MIFLRWLWEQLQNLALDQMARSLRQIRCGQLSVSFRHWRALQILEARQTVVIRRCLARLQRSRQSSGFRKWNKVVQYLVALEKQQEKLVHRVFGRLCNRSVALAFHFWTTSQNLEKRQERLVLKIFGHLCNRSVSLAFGHWSAATTMMKGMSDAPKPQNPAYFCSSVLFVNKNNFIDVSVT